MYLRVHELMGKKIVALCDEELLGNVYEKDGLVLDLKTHQNFYSGITVGEEEAKKHLENFDSANIVGKRSVSLAVRIGLCRKSEVKKIAGIPHIQIYKF